MIGRRRLCGGAALSVLAGLLVVLPAAPAAARPANDDRADARLLLGRSGTLTQTTVGATPQYALGDSDGEGTVWFRWRATHSGWETFDTRGSQAATWLIAFPPGSFTSGDVFWSRLFGRQDSDLYAYNAYPGKYAARHVRVVEGAVYYVKLWTATSRANTVRLSWSPSGPPGRPANDDLKDARLLTGSSGVVSGTTKGATYQPGESALLDECAQDCGHLPGDFGQSVWFRWTPPADGTWRLHNGELGEWSWIQVYRGGPSIGSLVLVKQRIGYPGSYPSTLLDVALKGGTLYTIRYSSYSYHDAFRLRWGLATASPTPPPPPNDDFAEAIDLGSSAKGSTSGTSQWSTLQAAEPLPVSGEVDSTVWFGWTAPISGLATIGSPQYGMSTRIYTGQSFGGLQHVPPTYWGDPNRRPTFQAVAGTRYWIQLGGTYSAGGEFDLTWDISVPPNDDLSDAYVLPSGPAGVSPDWGLVRSTGEPGEPPTYADDTARNTVWMRWKPTHSGRVSFVTTGDHVPTLDAFSGPATPSFATLTPVGSGTFGVEFDAQAGVTYWLRLHAELSSNGHVGWTQKWEYVRPTVGASLDGGAARTRDTWVALRLTGSDSGSGLRGWLVSMAAHEGEILAAAWVPANGQTARTVRWSVTHTAYGGTRFDGSKRVYVQAVDRQGNVSPVIGRSIMLTR
jgi:hypothetical protein